MKEQSLFLTCIYRHVIWLFYCTTPGILNCRDPSFFQPDYLLLAFMKMFPVCIKPCDHRTVEVERDLYRSSGSSHALSRFDYIKGWGSITSLDNLFQCLTPLTVKVVGFFLVLLCRPPALLKKFKSCFSLHFSLCLPLVLSMNTTEKTLAPSYIYTHW